MAGLVVAIVARVVVVATTVGVVVVVMVVMVVMVEMLQNMVRSKSYFYKCTPATAAETVGQAGSSKTGHW